MPFQSEKQRRYLHANHPEIAQRWERDYANGGISNHFRRRFDTGAYGRSYNPGAGGVVQHGPISTGGNGGGGGGGGGGPKPHSGPTLAEIEAQKKAAAAADEARLQALEDARSKQMYENTMAKRKKNIKHKKKIDTMGFDESQKFVKGLIDFGPQYYANLANQKKIKSGELDMGYNEFQKFGKGLMDFAPDYYENLAKVKEYNKEPSMDESGQWYDADGNPIDNPNINPDFASMINPIAAVKEDFIKTQSWYNAPLKLKQNTISTALSEDGAEKIQAFKNLKSKIGSGGLTVEKYLNLSKAGKIPSIIAEDLNEQVLEAIEEAGGFGETFQKNWSTGVVEPTFEGGVLDIDESKLEDKEAEKYLHVAEGGVARKNYYHGGILDINESEEIISDDGNDIELTAYNAEFDDPNDLSTGVKTLFQAKDGGTPQLAKKSKDGKRPGYGGPHDSYDAGQSYSGSQNTGGSTNRERGIQQAYSQPAYSPTGDASVAEDIAAADRKRKAELKNLVATGPGSDWEKYDSEEQMLQDKFTADQPGDIRRGDYEIGRDNKALEEALAAQKSKFKKMGWTRLLKAAALLVIGVPPKDILRSVMITKDDMEKILKESIPVMKAKHKLQGTLEKYQGIYEKYGMPTHSPHTDTELQKVNQQILDLTQRPDKEEDKKGDGPELPEVVPVHEEIDEYEGTYAMSPWDRIKANQAKRAMLVEKGIIQDNPVVDESVTDITMQANSGGLANLFRVKNQ